MPKKNIQPDWAYWSAMHDVALWEAVLLSLNVEPRLTEQRYSSEAKISHLSRLRGFRSRFELSKNNLSRKLHVEMIARGTEYTRVLLTDFAKFANDVGMSIPDEFPTEQFNVAPARLPEYLPPYLEFMLKAAEALNLQPNDNRQKQQIEEWLIKHWPAEFGEAVNTNGESTNKIRNMATFLRRPNQERGGNQKKR